MRIAHAALAVALLTMLVSCPDGWWLGGKISGQVSLGSSLRSLANSAQSTKPSEIIPGRLIVKFKPGQQALGLSPLQATLAKQSVLLQPLRNLASPNTQLLQASLSATQTLELAQTLSKRPDIEYAVPDKRIHALAAPSDPDFSKQWALAGIPPFAPGALNVQSAWDISSGAGSVVAVIDSGVALGHPDLQGQLLPGYDFVGDTSDSGDGDGRDNNPDDPSGSNDYHGTHVAGIIAAKANNGIGVAGTAFNAKVLPLRILGLSGGSLSDMIDAVLWAAGYAVAGVPSNANKADVINLSVGGDGKCDPPVQEAFNRAIEAGSSIVIAAGNEGKNVWETQPASCAGAIVVGATGPDGASTNYSNYGSRVTLMAPGGEQSPRDAAVWSTIKTSSSTYGYGYLAGTSMATPHVAGVLALMRSTRGHLTPGQLEQLLTANTRPVVNCATRPISDCGAGLVDAGKALLASKNFPLSAQADFALLPNNSSPISSVVNGTATLAVTVKAFNGFNAPVALSLQSAFGITGSFSPSSVPPNGSSTLILATGSAAAGNYPLLVRGTANGITHSFQVNVCINTSAVNCDMGGTVLNTKIVTCPLPPSSGNEPCDLRRRTFTPVLKDGVSASYSISGLTAGAYRVMAWKDLNDSKLLDAGDYFGEYAQDVQPSFGEANIVLEQYTAANASPAVQKIVEP